MADVAAVVTRRAAATSVLQPAAADHARLNV
jgi:hypothetical protein